ncbi:MAG: hypothetical protein J6A09_00075, partial [Alphaproteobacteria bacterium]|nr:hypothetical protein [Alphaproteobacteria bacterium]
MLHILPFLLLMIPFLLLFDVSLKRSKKAVSAVVQKTAEPDISELEEKLTKLIENNKINLKINELHEELAQSRTNTVSAYIKLNKKDLKNFSLNFSDNYIKNNYPEHIPTGFSELDKLLGGGLAPGLIVLGAISSLGKSTFSLQVAQNIAKQG